ncbi:HEAT repeat domain-containing protein [Nostoc sp. FACHB-87]|uniref:HEAT repeat domain-containing protein n=1 Tax=Nostocaceae TaxID=1162 RepID=UPI001687FA56|nr:MULTISPECIES: HEAT repeat domain-containing protein [Nostocaceae]MBD2456858.1 HEAT repeat domain-containing protein [Nostoc sp. FACHB-87]MBD2478132.1 HEAT repeat domain-containing protein [Anabaena sp. FACHB-83]
MSLLTDALDRIETWLVSHQPEFALSLAPGLTRPEIDAIVENFPYRLPEELYEFYGWHNGCQSLSCGYVVPKFDNFFSLQEALKWYADFLSWGFDWNPQWLTILDFNGDYRYAIVTGEDSAPVWFIDPECGIEEIRWDSLTDLMLATAECYETGAYYLDDEGYMETDEQKVAEIHRKYNYRGRVKSTTNESYNPEPPTVASEVDLSHPNALEELIQALQAAPLSPDAGMLQEMAANTLDNLANLGLANQVGAEPLVIGLQNILYDNAGHALAAQKLGELGDIRAVEPLLQVLNHPSSKVRTNAIKSLVKLGDSRAVEPLIQCLQDSDFFVRADAAWALAEFGDTQAIEPLIEVLSYQNHSTACRAIASALGKFGDVRAIEPLSAVFRSNGSFLIDVSSFPHVKLAVVHALRLIDDSRTTDILVEFLRDREGLLQAINRDWLRSEQATQQVIETLFTRQYPDLIPILAQLMQDSESRIQMNIISAIAKIVNPQIVDLLILVLASEDNWLRKMSISFLGNRRETKAVEPLLNILQNPNADLRLTAVQALEKIDDSRVVDALITMLKDEDDHVRGAAALALGNVGNYRAVEALNQCLADENSVVRKIVQQALNKIA